MVQPGTTVPAITQAQNLHLYLILLPCLIFACIKVLAGASIAISLTQALTALQLCDLSPHSKIFEDEELLSTDFHIFLRAFPNRVLY